MSLSKDQRDQFNKLIEHRDVIIDNLSSIENILKIYFSEEFYIAYQHWIPQIITALKEDSRWLPRGDRNMQQTIDRLADKIFNESNSGVSKYIK